MLWHLAVMGRLAATKKDSICVRLVSLHTSKLDLIGFYIPAPFGYIMILLHWQKAVAIKETLCELLAMVKQKTCGHPSKHVKCYFLWPEVLGHSNL